jgi:hypothetical protein
VTGERVTRGRRPTENETARDAFRIITIDDSARAHQPPRPRGFFRARGAVVVGLPLAGRPLQMLI